MGFLDKIKARLPKMKVAENAKLKEFSQRFFQDRYDKLLKDLLNLERDNPEDMRIKQKIAEVHFKKGNTEEAITKYRQMATYYEREEFVLKAIKSYKSILKLNPTLLEINLKLAALYLKVDMIAEAGNQYRVAINALAVQGNRERAMALAQDLVKIDPSNANRQKLAEIYQSNGMLEEAIKQYEILAKDFRTKKQYDDLLTMYERILPYRPDNIAILKDVCILYLRQQKPEKALKLIDHYKREADPAFTDLITKGRLMIEAMKKHNKPVKKT
jgi:pilus assembly protein FimV